MSSDGMVTGRKPPEVSWRVGELFAACRRLGAPLDLRAYHEACGIRREIQLADIPGDGQLRWLEDERKFEIVLNRKLPRQFRRFVWAHEIAHAILLGGAGRIEAASVPELDVEGRLRSLDPTEILCDHLAGELLIPDIILRSFPQGRFPSLRVAAALARSLDVPLTTAAIRLVGSTSARCLLIIWEGRQGYSADCRLVPYAAFKATSFDRIPDVVERSSQPFAAHRTGRLRVGRWRTDLGAGMRDYYAESIPSRIRGRAAVISIVHFEVPSDEQGALFQDDETGALN